MSIIKPDFSQMDGVHPKIEDFVRLQDSLEIMINSMGSMWGSGVLYGMTPYVFGNDVKFGPGAVLLKEGYQSEIVKFSDGELVINNGINLLRGGKEIYLYKLAFKTTVSSRLDIVGKTKIVAYSNQYGISIGVPSEGSFKTKIAVNVDGIGEYSINELKLQFCLRNLTHSNIIYSDGTYSGPTIGSSGISSNAITQNHLSDNSVSGSKIQNNSIDGQKIKSLSINASHLSDYIFTLDQLRRVLNPDDMSYRTLANQGFSIQDILSGIEFVYNRLASNNFDNPSIDTDKVVLSSSSAKSFTVSLRDHKGNLLNSGGTYDKRYWGILRIGRLLIVMHRADIGVDYYGTNGYRLVQKSPEVIEDPFYDILFGYVNHSWYHENNYDIGEIPYNRSGLVTFNRPGGSNFNNVKGLWGATTPFKNCGAPSTSPPAQISFLVFLLIKENTFNTYFK